jgi:hypothetical protein
MNRDKTSLSLLLCASAFAFLACAINGSRSSVAAQEWDKVRGPVVPHDDFPADCSLCHEGDDWNTIRADFTYDHAKETGYALEGAHEAAECLRCHNDRGPVQLFSVRGCAGCHEDPHESRMGADCSSCHSQSNWLVVGAIADHARTRFPLVGAHAAAACFACHQGAEVGRFERLSVACIDCHADDLATAVAPDHRALGWAEQDCSTCHTAAGWGGGAFKHPYFPLTGAHRSTACAECHVGGVYAGTPNTCVGCHQREYDQTARPDHAAAGFGTQCQQCHSTSNWDDANFAHASWPLTGAHASTSCNACHGGGVYDGTPTNCFACHQREYTAAPGHVAGNFSTNCQQCHTTTTWQGASFSHVGIVNGCVACHLDDYKGATNPNHAAAGLGTQCQQCHGVNNWNVANFNHAGVTRGCVVCHANDFNPNEDREHQKPGASQNCQWCHDTNDWDD